MKAAILVAPATDAERAEIDSLLVTLKKAFGPDRMWGINYVPLRSGPGHARFEQPKDVIIFAGIHRNLDLWSPPPPKKFTLPGFTGPK